jgi:hypothetical protein
MSTLCVQALQHPTNDARGLEASLASLNQDQVQGMRLKTGENPGPSHWRCMAGGVRAIL